MLSAEVVNYVLIFCLFSTTLFIVTTYILFFVYRLPVYHIMSVYQVYYFLGFVERPWEVYFSGTSRLWEYVGFVPPSDAVLWSTIVVVLAHSSMLAGFLFINGARRQVPLTGPFSYVPQRPIIFYVMVGLFLLLGAYSSQLIYGDVTNREDILAVQIYLDNAGGSRLGDVSGYQTIFEELLPVGLIVLFSIRRMRVTASLLIVAFVIFRSFVGNGRGEFVRVLLIVGCILLIEARRRYPPVKVVVAGMLVLALFNFLGSDRFMVRKIAAGELTFGETFDNYLESRGGEPITGNMQEFDVLAAVLTVVPERTGYSYGTQYLRLLIWPIPRQWWVDKPVFTTVFDLVDYGHFVYLTITLYADSYMTIGLAGMIIILFLISMCMNSVYNIALGRGSPGSMLAYCMLLLSSPTLFRDGPVSAAYYLISTTTGALILCYAGKLRKVSNPGISARFEQPLPAAFVK